jgi:hypothetical protein
VAASVTVRGAKGCEGAKRPVLSGATAASYLFGIDEDYTMNTKVDFKLIELVLNGGGKRLGVLIDSPRGYVSYTQTNVDLIRCNTASFAQGCGLAMYHVGRVTIKGGTFFGNGNTGDKLFFGGALRWGASDGTVKSSLTVTGVNFTANAAHSGGAVFLSRGGIVVSRVWGFQGCGLPLLSWCRSPSLLKPPHT